MMISARRAPHALTAALAAVVLLLAACGSSSDTNEPEAADQSTAAGMTTPNVKTKAPAKDKDKDGTVTLTVDGQTSTFDSGECVILETSDVNLALSTNGLEAALPPKPGEFGARDVARVILPPPAGDQYRLSRDVHGQWSKSGDRANGHVEGTAKLLSGLTGGNDKEHPFSFDFDCPLSDITNA